MFIVGRAITGSGASGILNGGMTIVHSSVPRQHRQCTRSLSSRERKIVDSLRNVYRYHCFRNGFRGLWASLGSSAWRGLDPVCHLEMESVLSHTDLIHQTIERYCRLLYQPPPRGCYGVSDLTDPDTRAATEKAKCLTKGHYNAAGSIRLLPICTLGNHAFARP